MSFIEPYQSPPLYEVLMKLKSEIFSTLRVCMPAVVKAVYPSTNTVDVQLTIMQTPANASPYTYPLLLGCPIVTPQGGGVGMVCPPVIGDTCLVFFSDRCLSSWKQTGTTPMPLPNFRMHNLSDGFVLLGVNPTGNLLKTPLDAGEAGLCATKNIDGAVVAINSITNLISIRNASTDLAAILTGLTTTLTTLNAPTNSVISILNTLITSVTALSASIALEVSVIPGAAAVAAAQASVLAPLPTALAAVSASAVAALEATAGEVPTLLY